VSRADFVGGFVLEFAVLVGFFGLLQALLTALPRCEDGQVARLLRATLVGQVIVTAPLITSQGFGIFSEGSRIDYLYAASSAKYLTYAGILIASVQVPLLAHRISSRRFGLLDLAIMLVAFGGSVLSGSKGGVVLWLVAIAALVNYRRAGISLGRGLLALAVLGSALGASSVLIARFLNLDVGEFAELAFNRFFLVNDARALAFDFRTGTTPDAGWFAESFRSISSLFGAPPRNSPLGVLLYGDLFGVETGNGANASLAALLAYYSNPGELIILGPLAAIGALAATLILATIARAVRTALSRTVVLAMGLVCLQQYSQDFLAFQIVAPLAVLAMLSIWINDQRKKKPTRARFSARGVAPAERRHSGAGA
jgi:hypothetical protein